MIQVNGEKQGSSAPISGSAQTDQRFILAKLEEMTIVFSSILVKDILIVQRDKILTLPFYDSAVMGCVYYEGAIVTLISLHQILSKKAGLTRERVVVVRMNEMAENLAGMGLAIERVLGSKTAEQLPADLFNSKVEDPKMQLFRPEILNSALWQPKYWM